MVLSLVICGSGSVPTEDSSSTGKLPNQKSPAEDDQLMFQWVASIDRAINGVEEMSGFKGKNGSG